MSTPRKNQVSERFALRDGQWVLGPRRVLVWQPDPDAPPRPPKRRSNNTRFIAECGTESGYKRHLRQKTPTCAECRRAKTDAERERTRRRSAA